MNKLLLVTTLAVILAGCSATQGAPKNLDNFSKDVQSSFSYYQRNMEAHKAYAVIKVNNHEFFGFGYGYSTIEAAEKRALQECQYKAKMLNDDVQCYVYHSE